MSVDPKDVCAIIPTRGDVPLDEIIETLPYAEVLIRYPDRTERMSDGQTWHHEDSKILGRYYATQYTDKPYVYFQDDDIHFHNHDVLLDKAQPDRLTCNMHREWIEGMGYYDLAMVGLGAIMPTYLWEEPIRRYEEAYGLDDDAKMYSDFIVTALCPWVRGDLGHDILEVASAPNRLWRKGAPHLAAREVVMNNARMLRRVCLTIMAKNEAETLPVAIKSVEGLYDSILVVDTGSTDGTQDVARALGAEVIERPWVSMEHNREEMLQLGRLRGDYQLLVDADEEWVEKPVGWPKPLFLDCYVVHYAGPADYGHPRLIYSNYNWKFKGRVHAALFADPEWEPSTGDLPVPKIVHHGEQRHDFVPHVQSQVKVMTKEIEAGQNVARNLFHRAKAYEGLAYVTGEKEYWERAITDYEARVELSQGDEESYYSRFRLGCLLVEQRNLFLEGADHLMTAWTERPTRIESLAALRFYLDVLIENAEYPRGDVTMIHRDLYTSPH